MELKMKRLSSLLITPALLLFSLSVSAGDGDNGLTVAEAKGVPVSLFSGQAISQTPRKYGVSSLRGDLNTRGLALGASVLRIQLPNGKTVDLDNRDIDHRNASDLAWFGEVSGNEDSDVSLTLKNGLVFGRLRDGDDVFELSSDLDGALTIEQIDINTMPTCDTDAEHIVSSGDVATSAEQPLAAEGDAGTMIDLLVVYSTDALAAAGSVAQMEATAQAAVDAANSAFVNSNMSARYRLVHTAAANHTTLGSTGNDLDWVTNDAGVAALRNQYGADMVTILVDTPNSCGTAWVQRSPGPGFEGYAFAATDVDCAVGNLTFAHEHGHNMGFEHNPDNSSVGSDPNSASYPWSFAHHVDGSYRTVMSYSNPCSSGCARVTQYSNPTVSYAGVPTGIADTRDNAYTGDLTAPIVRDFRAPVIPLAGTVTFAAIGDYGDGSSAEGSVATLIDSLGVDFIVGAGDNRYGFISYDTAVGQFYCNYMTDVSIGSYCNGGNSPANAFFPTPGNHDYTDGGGINEYTNHFTLPGAGIETSGASGNERYYDFVQGPVHVFAIDSQGARSSTTEMNAQKAWLEQAMTASAATWQLVLIHHAPYSSANHGSYPDLQWPYAAWGADAVIAGHDHVYERLSADGIPYFVNGLGGRSIYNFSTPLANSQVRYNSNYGAMRIAADDTQMTFEFIDISATVIDTHTVNVGDANPNILNIRVAQSSDDAEELVDLSPTATYTNGHMTITSTDLELADDSTWHGGEQEIGIRFQNVNIPQGASITSAWLEFATDEAGSDPTTVYIRAQNSDNAATFSTANYNISSRPTTLASVPWSIGGWSTIGKLRTTPDLANVVQEVVDRASWQENNSMVFLITGSGTRTVEAYDGSTAQAPLLHVEYDIPTANQVPVASFSATTSELTANFTDASIDTDGSVLGWNWDFGDSNSSTNQNPDHTYAAAGSYTVTLTVTDNDGATDSTNNSVTVTEPDTEAPSITAPANVTIEATGVTTSVSLGAPIVSDNQDPDPTVTNNAPAAFPVGITTVTWTATDTSGNSANAAQIVTVTDTTAPTITAPANVSVESSDPVAVNLGTPTVSDLADPNPVVSNDAPAMFPIGTSTVVTWTATDTSGNSATDTQTVTVTEAAPQPPAAPSGLTATVEKTGKGKNKVITGITLTWIDNSNNETLFVIQGCKQVTTGRGKNRIVSCDYIEVGNTGEQNITSFSVDLSYKHDHFQVKAVNAEVSSAWSNELKI
jgi:PKD repeat protein